MDKNIIRKQILNKRSSLSSEFINSHSDLIINNLLPYIYCKKNIMIFMDMKNEVKITKLLDYFTDNNINVFIPKIFSDKTMKINLYKENELVLNNFGFYESSSENFYNPDMLDIIIIPGVAFDRLKNRIGFGKGYYDRFLESFNNDNILKIGICYDFQLLESIPQDYHDVKMNIIITESEVIE